MTWLNRYDIEDLQDRFDADEHPNLRAGAKIMLRLMRWVTALPLAACALWVAAPLDCFT